MNLGCIKPLCDLLTVMDSKIVQVALNGLENILRLGEQEAKQENNGTGVNPYCSLIEEAYGTVHDVHSNTCILKMKLTVANTLCAIFVYSGFEGHSAHSYVLTLRIMKKIHSAKFIFRWTTDRLGSQVNFY